MKAIKWPLFPYGGDYNPEQWPKEVWEEDADLMVKAGWNTATLPVFGWASLEPTEGRYELGWLMEVIEILHRRNIRVCLASGTASVPAWLAQKYHDVLVVGEDGQRRTHGNRHTFCPSSPNYRRLAVGLAGELAKTAAQHPAVMMVHINNEYGTRCWCPLCAAQFRVWLQKRFHSLEELNLAWNTDFWGHRYTSWEQIEPPTHLGEQSIQALKLAYSRFQSEALSHLCMAEAEEFRKAAPHLPITTNMMGAFFPLDYFEWAKGLDFVSWDCYPTYDADHSQPAFGHTLTRGLKGGQPFLLMEQSPSQQNWAPYNRLKAPGQLRLQSYSAVAHGADSVMYFQWRRGRGGIEKLHGAVMEHGGSSENRVFKEVAALGEELAKVGPLLQGSVSPARTALLFDWPNWWGLSASSGPSVALDYLQVVRQWFASLHRLGIAVEVVSPQTDLSRFDVVLAPLLSMLTPDSAKNILTRVEEGASLVATSFTGFTDENDLVFLEGAPGPLRRALGISVEETDALPPELPNGVVWDDGSISTSILLADRIRLEGAEVLGRYATDFYKGEAAVTKNSWGGGEAYYLATFLDDAGLDRFLGQVCRSKRIGSPLLEGKAPARGVEAVERVSEEGVTRLFLLNHGATEAAVPLAPGTWKDLLSGAVIAGHLSLKPRDVMILERT
jgi:beta-galactosidase